MNRKEFLQELKTLQPRIPEMSCRVVPSSFEADDPDLLAYPLPTDWEWVTCEKTLRAWKPTGVMMRLPLFWQAESPLNQACQQVGAPLFVNDPENMPLGGAAVAGAGMDTIVTEVSDAYEFSQYLAQKHIAPPRNWLLVHRADAPEFAIPGLLRDDYTRVAQEVHLFPLFPVLSQCTHLVREKASSFHAAEGRTIDAGEHGIRVSTEEPLLVPFMQWKLQNVLKDGGLCTCGLARYEAR